MEEESIKEFIKSIIIIFGIPSLIMVVLNWQFEGIIKISYWQCFWLKIVFDFLSYKGKNVE